MKKVICIALMSIGLAILFSSCGGETYADKLKKANKAISRYIDEKNINVITEYPKDGIFLNENDYFKEPKTGAYIHVINPGNDDKPVVGKTDVYLRYGYVLDLIKKDTLSYGNEHGTYMDFRYGLTSTYTQSSQNVDAQEYGFLSPACVIGLEYGLGNNAEISMIVPFESGSAYQQYAYTPFFYERLKYRFTLDAEEDEE